MSKLKESVVVVAVRQLLPVLSPTSLVKFRIENKMIYTLIHFFSYLGNLDGLLFI